MTDEIRVDYEAIEKIQTIFAREANAVTQLLQNVLRVQKQLQGGGWIGRGSDAFYAEMDEKINPAVRRLIEALTDASRTSKEIRAFMQEAEQEASSRFRNDADRSAGSNATAGAGDKSGSGNGAGSVSSPEGGASAGDGGTNSAATDSGLHSGLGQSGGNEIGSSGTAVNGLGSDNGGGGPLSASIDKSVSDLGKFFDSIIGGDGLGGSWGDDQFLNGSGPFGDLLGNNFNRGDLLGSNPSGNEYWGVDYQGNDLGGAWPGLGSTGNDWGIPNDWLSGVESALTGTLQDSYNDWGIPNDWLKDVDAAFGDLFGNQKISASDMATGSGGSGSGDSGSGSSGSGSSGGGSGGGMGEIAADSGDLGGASGSGSGSSLGGMGSGVGRASGLGSGFSGGGASGLSSSGLGGSRGLGNSMAYDLGGDSTFGGSGGSGNGQSAASQPLPVRFGYQQAAGRTGSIGNATNSGAFSTFVNPALGANSAIQAGQPNMGLSISLAAMSPFVALLGKALWRNHKSNDE